MEFDQIFEIFIISNFLTIGQEILHRWIDINIYVMPRQLDPGVSVFSRTKIEFLSLENPKVVIQLIQFFQRILRLID